jgi:hypothetical protein
MHRSGRSSHSHPSGDASNSPAKRRPSGFIAFLQIAMGWRITDCTSTSSTGGATEHRSFGSRIRNAAMSKLDPIGHGASPHFNPLLQKGVNRSMKSCKICDSIVYFARVDKAL